MGVSAHLNRSWTKRAAALVAITGAAFYGIATGGVAHAGVSTLVTVTGVSPHRLAALTSNAVITVTGTGFDEDAITAVSISGCTNDPTYIVQNATTLLLKTDNSCAVGTGNVIDITDSAGDDAVSVPGATGGKMVLDFVAAPTIKTADATHRPMVTENSSGVAYANQVASASTSGGTVVRVYAGGTVFVNSTTYPLAASLDGVAMTKVTMHTGGDYFTAVLGAHAADAKPVLKITSNGVSKSFVWGAGGGSAVAGTHDFVYAGNTISVSPASGPINGGTTLTVTGAGFTTGTTATVGGTSCTKVSQTATSFVCTVPATTAAGPVSVVVTTGSLTSVTSAGSTFTYLDA